MTIKTNIYSIEYNDDMKKLADKINYNFRNICREANISIGTNTGGEVSRHNDLIGRDEADSHPHTAISGLADFMSETSSRLRAAENNIRDILKDIEEIFETIEDHETRIKALEGK